MLYALAVFLLVSPLWAQEMPEEDPGERSIAVFPLALVLEAAEFAADGQGLWRPDWPPEFPPDAFKFRAGEIQKISIEGREAAFNFSLDPESREFPFMLNNRMAQAVITGGELQEISKIVLGFSAEESWELEVLEHKESYPYIIRGFREGAWCFVSLSRGVNNILETWYDEEGNILWVYYYSLTLIGNNMRIREIENFPGLDVMPGTKCYYDSRLFLTEISGPGGDFLVHYYREDLPRYWERRPAAAENESAGKYALQWDEQGLLLRLTGDPESGDIDYRYEYTLDEMGNWIERREIRMTRTMGLLVPSPGITVKRILEYGKDE